MIQSSLPTRDRLARMGKVASPNCTFCNQPDSISHVLSCPNSIEVATPFLNCKATYLDNSTTENIIMLNLETSESLELPALWLVATCMGYIWQERVDGKQARLVDCKAMMLARVSILEGLLPT